MSYEHFLYVFCIFFLTTISSPVHAQQPYIRKATTLCDSTDNSTSVLGYTCNGVSRNCGAYLSFRSQPPYNSVSSISALLAANPTELSQLNSVSENATFETNRIVVVPVQCSCSGQFYQSNASYVIQHENTYFLIANDTYQGLSTCQALQAQNSNRTRNIYAGTRINVPLRCACPTKNQTDDGVNYLLSYLITWGETVSGISAIFGVDTGKTLAANGLSEQDTTIYPFTTLLVPLENPPSSLRISPPPPPSPQQPTPELVSSSDNNSNKTWLYVVVAIVAALAIGLITGTVVYCLFFRKTKKKKQADSTFDSKSFEAIEKPLNQGLDEHSEDFWESLSSIAQSLEVYKFEELRSATDDFSPSYLINGSVYRGTINGDFAAIKRMNGDVSKEVSLLNKINHFNLIRLSGVSFNDGHWYLVYEYAANGPLSDWIFNGVGDQKFLNWTQRIQIALDVATGLNYLHSYTSPPHVHKDLRISNILLDSDLRAKIANFTLARSAEEQFVLTRHIVGTKGYMAPEYLEHGLVSPKLDVYAFGVLMLEMLTGKEISHLHEGMNNQLPEVLIPVFQEDNKEKLSNTMDPSLQGNYPPELATLLIRLIHRCINEDPSSRPGINEVAKSLSTIMTTTLSWELSLGVSGYHSMS